MEITNRTLNKQPYMMCNLIISLFRYAKLGLSNNVLGTLVTENVWMLSIKINAVYVQIKF